MTTSRPTVVPFGKYEGVRIVDLSHEDLIAARRDFGRVNGAVQGAVMAEIAKRENATRRRALLVRRGRAR